MKVIRDNREFWPLSVRQVHYRLLGPDAPLIHAKKPGSKYVNDKASYRALCDLMSRARIEGYIPWESIDDETRTTDTNNAFWNPAQFLKQNLGDFMKGYWRHLQQSQPHHIEIIAEKLTVRTILKDVAREYCIPLTISRGISSLPPKKAIADRYKSSRKDKLILLVISDFDPAGETIAEDWAQSLERDFGVTNIEAYKVALTHEHVEHFDLEPSMEAKETSPTYPKFVDTYGITDAYELEALEPEQLRDLLKDAIEEMLDMDALNAEIEKEREDSTKIAAVKRMAMEFLGTINLDEVEAAN